MSADSDGARTPPVTNLSNWNQLRSPGGVPIRAGVDNVLTIAGSFIRHINPLQYSASFGGHGRYEGPEHEHMADGLTLRFGSGSIDTWSTDIRFPLDGGGSVSYSQTIALAGDFFGVPSAPISDGDPVSGTDNPQSRFSNAFQTLNGADPGLITNILNVMNQQGADVNQRAQSSTASDRYSQAYSQSNANHYYDLAYELASGGSYFQLASDNWDHFGAHAVTAYTAGHTVALAQAATAGAHQDQALLQRAYLLEAFCAHFLSDLFAAGHLRTPRKALYDLVSPFPSLLSQIMHDEDNYNGLMVTSRINSQGWLAYGDKRMLDAGNTTNRSYARQALQKSLDEIWAAYQGTPVTRFAALDYIPDLNYLYNNMILNGPNNRNWSPLFIVPSDLSDNESNPDAVQIRKPPLDLSSQQWDLMDPWYMPAGVPVFAEYWYLLPSGGVHSLEGAPPGQIQQWAHQFAWSTHRTVRVDISPSGIVYNTMTPAAVVSAPLPSFFSGPGSPVVIETELPNTGDDTLHLFYRPSSADATMISHLTTPMSNVPGFAASCDMAPGDSQWTTAGQPAAVEFNGTIVVVFPKTGGTIFQMVSTNGGPWTGGPAIVGAPYAPMNANGTVALAKSGATLYLAYRGADNHLYACSGAIHSGSASWGVPMQVTINNQPVTASSDPSIMFTGDELLLAVAGPASGADPILVYQGMNSWQLFLSGLKDSSNHAITTKKFAQLFEYGDGYAVIGTGQSDDKIETIVPVKAANPKGSWVLKNINFGSTFLKTQNRVATIFYQGNPYIFYSESGSGTSQLSVVTSANVPS